MGIGVLVETVSGDAHAGAALVGVGRLDHEMVVAKRAEHAVLAGARLRHLGGAFDDLAEMPGEARIGAPHERQRREDGGVARPSGDDDVRALRERLLIGGQAHHRDDAPARVDGLRRQFLDRPQRGDPALGELALEVRPVGLRMDRRDPQPLPAFGGDLAHDLQHPGKVRFAAGAAGRADQHRNAVLPPGIDHQPEIALGGRAGDERRCPRRGSRGRDPGSRRHRR